jgi:hypothetical protein
MSKILDIIDNLAVELAPQGVTELEVIVPDSVIYSISKDQGPYPQLVYMTSIHTTVVLTGKEYQKIKGGCND